MGKSQSKKLFMPEIAINWNSIKIGNTPITTYPGMGKHWIPVFETEKECTKEYPNCDIIVLKMK